ncbi:hypothetical protein [Roseomonas chloroacetimidivorans]|uniref:hypothetical protein n=1 Tax=Roseomonas chloroacetimidivorans TaxID=1766656 RepID=UPI003C74C850
MAEAIGNLAVIITATDKATATIGRVRDSLSTTLEPSRQLSAAFGRLGEVSGLARVGGWLGAARTQAAGLVGTLSSAAFPLAAGGVVASAAAMATNFVSTSKGLLEGSRSLGMSVEDLGAFRNAARLAGLGADEAQGGLERFDAVLTDAFFGRNPAAVAASQMRVIGFSIRDAEGRARSGADALGDLAEAYAKLNHDPNAQGELARIWGVEALDKFLRRGREGVADLLRQGRERGVITREQAEQAKRIGQVWDSLGVSADRLTLSVGIGMAPSLDRASASLDRFSRARANAFGEQIGREIDDLLGTLERLVTTGRDLYTAYDRLTDTPFWRWFFDRDPATPATSQPWSLSGPIGRLSTEETIGGREPRTGLANRATREREHDWEAAGAPRGIRNNNPLNLTFAGQAGAVREPGEGRFARFGTMEEGVAANVRQMMRHAERRGADTLQKLIGIWAPPGDGNDTQSYVASVAFRSGIGPNERIDFSNASQVGRIVAAMAQRENGQDIDPNAIASGVAMALGRPVSAPVPRASAAPSAPSPASGPATPGQSASAATPTAASAPPASVPAPLSLNGAVAVTVRLPNAPTGTTASASADGIASVEPPRIERGMGVGEP